MLTGIAAGKVEADVVELLMNPAPGADEPEAYGIQLHPRNLTVNKVSPDRIE